ncbi:hypothetical protein BRARA_C04136 [Brassica rapa]|uniref:F-box domain-containing protein n=1 Tax=Brassica campestris TaxID=3711 RepID=A0A398A6E2_BRACM|nr:hypothetical protein BRARA_C04136 [Brassica rapa]
MGMISDLPDHMLLKILSWLPTREVVATMLLSRQWKFLWKQVAKLDYDFSQNDGKTFRTLSTGFCSYTRVGFLEVSSYRNVGTWINFAVSRKVRDLEIDLTAARNPMITTLPKSMYTCGTLTCLKVKALVLDDIPEEYPICLASLRYLYLSVSSQVSAHMFIGKLTAGAPLLKKSVVRGDNVYNKQFLDYMARKNSLKSFTLCSSESCNLRRCFLWAEPITTSFPKCLSSTLETLEWRDYMDTQFDKDVISFLLKNSTCLTKVKIVPVSTAGDIEKLRIRTYLSNLSRGSTACQRIFP